MGIQEQLAGIKTRISQQTALQARAQLRKERAQEDLEKARTKLREDFGVSTGDEIRAKKAELEATLETALAEAERLLEESS
jgi:uncharacterized protein YllA (UPF0747 family)